MDEARAAPWTQSQTVAPRPYGIKKTLVAYFSHTVSTETVAQLIESETGADIFKIETATPYPSVYRETTELAKQEKADNARPALQNKVENMAQYDFVFGGYPLCWYTAPLAVANYADSLEFSCKTVLTFLPTAGSPLSNRPPEINNSFKRPNVI